jgi:hypothetical protein
MLVLLIIAALGATAVADDQEPVYYVPMKPVPPPPPAPEPWSTTPAYIATGVTGALVIATGVVWLNGRGDDGMTMYGEPTPDATRLHEAQIRRFYWEVGGLAGATVLSGVVTAVLWSKTGPSHDVLVAPTLRGATVSLSGRF